MTRFGSLCEKQIHEAVVTTENIYTKQIYTKQISTCKYQFITEKKLLNKKKTLVWFMHTHVLCYFTEFSTPDNW